MNVAIVRAQLWELWRLTRLELLLRFLSPLPIIFMCLYLPVLEGVVYFGMVLTSVTSQLWLQGFDQRQRGGFPFILTFTQPVTTRWLVGVPMAWLLVSNCLIYMGLVCVARLILPTSYPGWVMLPFLLTVSACLAMATWSTTDFGERAIVTIAMSVVLALVFRPILVALDPLATEPGTRGFGMKYTPLENGILALVTTIAIGLTIYFVRNQRSGEYHSVVGERAGRVFRNRDVRERRQPFPSSIRAQIWFEWRRVRGRAMATVFTGVLTMAFFTWLLRDERDGVALYTLGFIHCFAMLALILLVTEGVSGMKYSAKVLRLSVYEATQPLSVGSNIVLKLSVAASVALVGSVMLLLAGIYCAVFLRESEAIVYAIAWVENLNRWGCVMVIGYSVSLVVVYSVACLTVIQLAMTLGYCALWIERHRVMFMFGLSFILFPLFVSVVEHLTRWDLPALYEAYLLVWGILLIAVAILSMGVMLRLRLYRPIPTALVVLLWMVCLVLLRRQVYALNPNVALLSDYAMVFVCGLCCIPIGSVAWAPLALAAQRNQ